MRKRRFIVLVVVAVCVLASLTVAIRRTQPGTVYRGQPLQTWTVRAYQGDSNAVEALKELGTNAIPEFIKLLKTRDSFVRKQTWAHLPKLPLRLRRKIARTYAAPQAETVREAAARALGRLGGAATAAIPPLSRALCDTQGRVRWEAATALALIGQDAVPDLIASLDENDARARHAAAYALGQIGPEAATALSALIRKLDDQDQTVRNSAAYSLTAIGTTGIVALIDTAKSGRKPACESAIHMLTNSFLPSLKITREFFHMAQSESPVMRRQAIEALGTIRPVGSSAIHASLEALQDSVLEVRLAAIKTLEARGGTNQKAVQALTRCLRDESPQVREAAARALGNLGVHAKTAIPELIRLSQGGEKPANAAAQEAIVRIRQTEPETPTAQQR